MNPFRIGCLVLAALLAGIVSPQVGRGSITGTGAGSIQGKAVSGQIDVSIVGGKLQILLTNTGPRSDYGSSQVLTDITFNMQSVNFAAGPGSGSSVVVPTGSALYKSNGQKSNGPYDVSCEWGLARNVTLQPSDGATDPLGPFDFSVTATSFGGSETKFANNSISGGMGLDAEDFGLLSNAANRNTPGIGSLSVIIGRVLITLAAVDPSTGAPITLTDSDLSRFNSPTFSFGSIHTGIRGVADDLATADAPEPSALAVWSLLGGCGLAIAWRRRQRAAR
jgi:hypothetical protein